MADSPRNSRENNVRPVSLRGHIASLYEEWSDLNQAICFLLYFMVCWLDRIARIVIACLILYGEINCPALNPPYGQLIFDILFLCLVFFAVFCPCFICLGTPFARAGTHPCLGRREYIHNPLEDLWILVVIGCFFSVPVLLGSGIYDIVLLNINVETSLAGNIAPCLQNGTALNKTCGTTLASTNTDTTSSKNQINIRDSKYCDKGVNSYLNISRIFFNPFLLAMVVLILYGLKKFWAQCCCCFKDLCKDSQAPESE